MSSVNKDIKSMIKDEMEKYRDEDRQQEAGACIIGEAKKDRTSSDKNKYYWMWREEKKKRQEAEGEVTIVKGIGENSPEMKSAKSEVEALKQQLCTDRNEFETHLEEAKRTIKNLEARLAELLEVDESHQRLNGKLQERLTEVEGDNKKLSNQIEDKINQMRRSGM